MRRRYLALKVEVEGDRSFNEESVIDAVWQLVYQLFGEFGASQTGLALARAEISTGQNICVVRCYHNALDMVKTSIAAITNIKGTLGAVRLVAVSGTMRGLKKKLAERGASCG